MKKAIFLFIALFGCQFLTSQNNTIPAKETQKGFFKIDYLSINMPELPIDVIEYITMNESNIGVSGIHYNLNLNNAVYAGVGIYGAVNGYRGGFFTLGVNAGLKKYITKKLYLDLGIHFGAGGGARAPDGGGAFLLPHTNIGYNFDKFSINAGWSYINFFDDGLIKDHQFNVALEIPLQFNYSNYNNSEKGVLAKDLNTSRWNQKAKKTSLMVHLNNLKVLSEADATTGEVLNGKTIRLAGFEFANYFSKNWFAFLKVDGAYNGIRAGYMDVFLGGGYNFNFNKNRTNIVAKFAVGAGGGGGIDTDGGFFISPDLSLEQKLFKNLYLSINKGFLLTPSQYFSTETFGFGLKYYAFRNGSFSDEKEFTSGKFKGINILLKQDWYINAIRMDDPTEDLHQISLQVNLDLNKNIYIAGQTSFANFGNAGAYAEGIVGMGIKSNSILNTFTFFVQALAGAAGGGGISTGEGLIFKPSIGSDIKLNDKLGLRGALGYAKAKGGDLSSAFFSLGLNYKFTFLSMK